jgi:hypothetical protein
MVACQARRRGREWKGRGARERRVRLGGSMGRQEGEEKEEREKKMKRKEKEGKEKKEKEKRKMGNFPNLKISKK